MGMDARQVERDRLRYRRSSKGIVQDVDGQSWLLLMQMTADDRVGAEDKTNGAMMIDRNFQLDGGEPRERASFDSVFNAFPTDFYATAAGLEDATFLARLEAPEWHVQVFDRVGLQVPRILAEAKGHGCGEIALPFGLTAGNGARVTVTITYRGVLHSDLMAFATPAPADPQPLGLSITTYNKPDYVRRNLDVIADSNAARAGLIDLLVVNNGDPIDGMADDIAELRPGNLGGTGGFRAAAGHFRDRDRAHFVIMDDDIILPPDMVDRFYALSCLVTGRHVGSLAEIENTPDRLVKEQGADVAPHAIFGLDLVNPMLDLQGWHRDALYRFRDVDYSGWWALMVDLSVDPQAIVPPYFFIKRDDITFGLESRATGTPTTVFPNLVIAHSEEGAASYMYYDVRNDLVMRARNADRLGMSIQGIARQILMKFVTYRLDEQRMLNRGLSDFMAGPDRLASRPVGDVLREIRGIAGTRVPLPEKSVPVHAAGPQVIRTWRKLAAWLRPSAWQVPDPLPVMAPGQTDIVARSGGYIAATPFSSTGVVYRRRLACVGAFAKGVFLLGRLIVTRGRVVDRYRKAKA